MTSGLLLEENHGILELQIVRAHLQFRAGDLCELPLQVFGGGYRGIPIPVSTPVTEHTRIEDGRIRIADTLDDTFKRNTEHLCRHLAEDRIGPLSDLCTTVGYDHLSVFHQFQHDRGAEMAAQSHAGRVRGTAEADAPALWSRCSALFPADPLAAFVDAFRQVLTHRL